MSQYNYKITGVKSYTRKTKPETVEVKPVPLQLSKNAQPVKKDKQIKQIQPVEIQTQSDSTSSGLSFKLDVPSYTRKSQKECEEIDVLATDYKRWNNGETKDAEEK